MLKNFKNILFGFVLSLCSFSVFSQESLEPNLTPEDVLEILPWVNQTKTLFRSWNAESEGLSEAQTVRLFLEKARTFLASSQSEKTNSFLVSIIFRRALIVSSFYQEKITSGGELSNLASFLRKSMKLAEENFISEFEIFQNAGLSQKLLSDKMEDFSFSFAGFIFEELKSELTLVRQAELYYRALGWFGKDLSSQRNLRVLAYADLINDAFELQKTFNLENTSSENLHSVIRKIKTFYSVEIFQKKKEIILEPYKNQIAEIKKEYDDFALIKSYGFANQISARKTISKMRAKSPGKNQLQVIVVQSEQLVTANPEEVAFAVKKDFLFKLWKKKDYLKLKIIYASEIIDAESFIKIAHRAFSYIAIYERYETRLRGEKENLDGYFKEIEKEFLPFNLQIDLDKIRALALYYAMLNQLPAPNSFRVHPLENPYLDYLTLAPITSHNVPDMGALDFIVRDKDSYKFNLNKTFEELENQSLVFAIINRMGQVDEGSQEFYAKISDANHIIYHLLEDKKLNINLKDANENTALDLAKKFDLESIEQLIKERKNADAK